MAITARSMLAAFVAAVVVACSRPATRHVALRSEGSWRLLAEQGVTGDLRVHQFTSAVFSNTRSLRVWLPPGYDEPANSTRRYPVLYLNDGQNLFDAATAIFNPIEWRVDETTDALIRAGEVAPLIVVGIDNAGRRGRAREYLPYVDAYLRPPEPDPQGKRYPDFLINEVMPFINARYRTATEPQYTGLGGSSYGGLITLYTVLVRPGVFGRVLIESPSLYVDGDHVLRDAERARWPERVYLGVGTNEGGRDQCDSNATQLPQAAADVRRLETLMRRDGLDSTRIAVTVESCAVHDEAAWARRLPNALRFLFPNGDGNLYRR